MLTKFINCELHNYVYDVTIQVFLVYEATTSPSCTFKLVIPTRQSLHRQCECIWSVTFNNVIGNDLYCVEWDVKL